MTRPKHYRRNAIATAAPPRVKTKPVSLESMWELRVPLENGGKQVIYAKSKAELDAKYKEYSERDPDEQRPERVGNWASITPGVIGGSD